MNSNPPGNLIGNPESDTRDIIRQPIRILLHHLKRTGSILLINLHSQWHGDPISRQKHHGLPKFLLHAYPEDSKGYANRTLTIEYSNSIFYESESHDDRNSRAVRRCGGEYAEGRAIMILTKNFYGAAFLGTRNFALCGERPEALPLDSAAFEKAGETFIVDFQVLRL